MGIAAAGVAAAGSIAGGVMSSNASQSAASTEANAANNAAAIQQQAIQYAQHNLQPFVNTGAGNLAAENQLISATNTQGIQSGGITPATTLAGEYFGAAEPYYGENQQAQGYALGTLSGAQQEFPLAQQSLSGSVNALQTASAYNQGAMQTINSASNNIAAGNNLVNAAAGQTNLLANGINQQTLENTPGYQFTLQQGLESTQNSAAARGLANSGAALKGAATYATGLANDTYQSQYNDIAQAASLYNQEAGQAYTGADTVLNQGAQQLAGGNQLINVASGYNSNAAGQMDLANTMGTNASQIAGIGTNLGAIGTQIAGLGDNYINLNTAQQGNITNDFDRLSGVVGVGENAAAGSGNIGVQGAANVGNSLTSAGTAQAAGITGSAAGINSAISGVSGSASQYLLYQNLLNGGGGLSSGSSSGYYGI